MTLRIRRRDTLPDHCILNAPEQTKCITINTVGAMGRGVALAAKLRYPHVYTLYRQLCSTQVINDDALTVVPTGCGDQLLLFPTKRDWKQPSDPDMIIRLLDKLVTQHAALQITSLAMVPLGMSNGWLKGNDRKRVQEAMEEKLAKLPFHVALYV